VAWGFTTGVRTLLRDVERVTEPWTLAAPDFAPRTLDADARADALWALLCAAVRATSAQRPRAALSGGLDSRAIAAAAAGLPGLTLGTFGEQDAVDLPVAATVGALLGAPHTVSVLSAEAAYAAEARVFEATGGLGGSDAAPGAQTDADWAVDCDLLLSGMSGDVIWGDTALAGRTPDSRLRKLGVSGVGEPSAGVPAAPPFASASGSHAWLNLWTRQACVTWNGVLPRLAHTPVVPVCWEPPLLSFCLGLEAEDRADRALLRRMLARHAPEVARVPAVRGATLDLDRAMSSDPTWRRELDALAADTTAWARLGLDPRGVARLMRLQRDGKRRRAALVSRLRVLRRWAARIG
jgi:hypothetical protein